jgi:hypothetical protein
VDRITGSVGRGGRNAHDDVRTVQRLLRESAHLLPGLERVPLDGNLDDRTADAIVAFQKRIVNLPTPDGRVDPRGRTFRILQGEQPHGVTSALRPFKANEGGGVLYAYEPADRQWGTAATLDALVRIARALKGSGIAVGVGDISFSNGGRMPPHASHTRGVDVDLRPQRDDEARAAVTLHDAHYSRERTRKVADADTKLVLFNDRAIPGVEPWVGHDNHLHVRFKA